nr:hypothetical protein CcurKRNrm2_p159 [Cryptomonas curvata]
MLNLSQFIIGLIIKLVQQFISVLCKKKLESKMLLFFLKFGNYVNRQLILSSIGISFFNLLKDRFGCRIIIQFLKLMPDKNFFSLIIYRICDFLWCKYSCQVLEFFFQNIKSKQQKSFAIIFLIFFNEINYSKLAYKFYNKFYNIRSFFSGFSFEIGNKLKLLFANKIFLLKKNFFNHSPSFSSTVLLEFFRFSYKFKDNSKLIRIIFQNGYFLSNSFKGLLLVSNASKLIKKEYLLSFFRKIVFILPNFLKNRYGHILILIIFEYFILNKENLELANLIDNLFYQKNQLYEYSGYIYLYFLDPNCKVFRKKKKYKLIQGAYFQSIFFKLNKNNKIDLYHLLNYKLKFKNFFNSHLIVRRLIEYIKLSDSSKKFFLLKYVIKNKLIINNKKLKFKKFQNIFYFLKHISNRKLNIKSKLFIFNLFDFNFERYFSYKYSYFGRIKLFRCFSFSKNYNKKFLIQNENNYLKIILPLKLNYHESILNLIFLDRLTDI